MLPCCQRPFNQPPPKSPSCYIAALSTISTLLKNDTHTSVSSLKNKQPCCYCCRKGSGKRAPGAAIRDPGQTIECSQGWTISHLQGDDLAFKRMPSTCEFGRRAFRTELEDAHARASPHIHVLSLLLGAPLGSRQG
eukprot:441198-Pelagomonas_calceolata.AAC.10